MANGLPSRAPVGIILAVLVGFTSCLGLLFCKVQSLPPMQGFYLNSYFSTATIGRLGESLGAKNKAYLVTIIGGNGALKTGDCGSKDQLVTDANLLTAQSLDGCILHARPTAFHAWLKRYIYQGVDLTDLFLPALKAYGALLFCFLVGGSAYDSKRKVAARKGVRLRGPELVSRWRFNRLTKGDGYPIKLANRRNFFEFLMGERGKYIRIKRKHENNHVIAMADAGGGKTSAFFQIIDEIQRRGEVLICYDPHMQFTPRYFKEESDFMLNFLDNRGCSWSPSDEIDYSDRSVAKANALAQATSILPGNKNDKNWFFVYCGQQIWAHLIVEHRPDCHELAYMLEHSEPLVDMVVKGTELETMMTHNAAQMRAGVVAHLSQVVFALRQVPKKEPGRKHLIIRDWCKTRKGNMFYTNTQDTRDGLRPLQSLMLDWTIMCMLSLGERPDLKPVLAAFDELQTLQKLGQLMPLVTEGRKSLRVVLGFQGRSQIRALYGDEAEAIFSAPFTKFLMRTSEPEASEWLSKTVGDIEVERIRETIPAHVGGQGNHSYSTEQRVEKLVMSSEFQGLDDRIGYLKYGNLILKFELPIMPKIEVAPRFIPRAGILVEKRPLPTLKQAKELAAEAMKPKKEAEEEEKKLRISVAKSLEKLARHIPDEEPVEEKPVPLIPQVKEPQNAERN